MPLSLIWGLDAGPNPIHRPDAFGHAGSQNRAGPCKSRHNETQTQGAPAATGGADGRQTDKTQRHGGSNGTGTRSDSSSNNNTGDNRGDSGGGQQMSRSPYLLRGRSAASQTNKHTQASGDETTERRYKLRSYSRR